MRVMISGSGGMLATALIDELLVNPAIEKIYALSSSPQSVLARHRIDSRLRALDFNEATSILASGSCDVLVHAAFPRQNDSESIAEGVEYTKRLLECVPSSCAVIHISSQSVYDPMRSKPAKEDLDMEKPTSPYAVAKLDSEQLVSQICPSSKFSNLRLASLISPEFEDRFVNKLVHNALQLGEISVFGPNNQFGFLDVKDAAAAIASMVVRGFKKDWHAVYNVGPHCSGYSLEEISNKVKDAVIRRGKACQLDTSLDVQVSSSALDSSRFEQDFCWMSQRMLDDTIGDIIDYQLESR